LEQEKREALQEETKEWALERERSEKESKEKAQETKAQQEKQQKETEEQESKALEKVKKEWALERERLEKESKEKAQETKAQQEKQQKGKEEQEWKDKISAPGMSNVCASLGCKQERKKKCTFGMCICCCKLRPAAGTPQGKCILGTYRPGHT